MEIVDDTARLGERHALMELYRRASWASHHHHPRYAQLVPLKPGGRRTLVGYRGDIPHAYANVIERGHVLARLRFGPVFAEVEDAVDFIIALVDHYRHRGFVRLEVQLYEPAGSRGEWIAYQVARERRFTSEVTTGSRGTAVIPLSGDSGDWSDKRLSANHRRSVKKARALGLRTEPMTESDVRQFSDQYVRMYRWRRLPVDATYAHAMVAGKFSFLRETGEGLALKVCAADGAMLGGLLIMREGNRAFYDLGATDPERRHIPILHLGILDSIAWASMAGCTDFDLGGYGFLADASDQVGKINRFKDGFRPQPIFFTRPMLFALSPAGGRFFDVVRSARQTATSIFSRPLTRREESSTPCRSS